MLKGFHTTTFLVLALMVPAPALSTVVFDFDDVAPSLKKQPGGVQVELYMEGLYGSNVSVSQKTHAVRGAPIYGAADPENAYLQLGKGKGASAIVIHFDDDPIDSFSVDFKLLKKAKKFSIYADGELISLDTLAKGKKLTKAEKKQGLSGQKTFYFDEPIHTLEFVGKKKSFVIDNLIVDLPTDTDGNTEEEENGTEENNQNLPQFPPLGDTSRVTATQVSVPEPSSLLLFIFGFAAVRLRSFFSKPL